MDISEEEEEELIEKVAEKIHEYEMETPAILYLESFKPLAYIGGQMGRLFVSPYLPALSKELGIKGEKILRVFEKRENVEKLIELLEEKSKEDREKEEIDVKEKLDNIISKIKPKTT